jgi:2-octaprenylphenol hydroxylase
VKVLSRYERRRMPHNLALMAAMEGFERLFQADPLPLRWLRNAGLKMVEQMPEAKALFVRQALGLTGDLPALARAPGKPQPVLWSGHPRDCGATSGNCSRR